MLLWEAEDEKIAELLSLQQVVGTLEPRDKKLFYSAILKIKRKHKLLSFWE